jgi:colanic acid biosynthesis glycosyl transferase WcaI
MHLVFINQYYPPDVAPTGLMLEAVAECLVASGHEVTVLCAEGGYGGSPSDVLAEAAEQRGIRVERIRATGFGRGSSAGKLADYLTFYLGVAVKLMTLRLRPDRVVALTTPPYLSILARILSRFRGADHAHWVMDLYPDVMTAHGMLGESSVAARILKGLTRYGFGGRRSRVVMSLGPDMDERVRTYLSAEAAHEWVPLWGTADDESGSIALSQDSGVSSPDPRPMVLMYSGNMGLGHRFGEFLQASAMCGPGFLWRFNGEGKRRSEIEEFMLEHPAAPLELGGYVPRSRLAEHLASADVHLASLDPVWDGTMVPSKLQGIFTMARPVIFVGSKTGAMGRWITESGGGWVVEPGDLAAMQQVLIQASDPYTRSIRGNAARSFAAVHFSRSVNAKRIAESFCR